MDRPAAVVFGLQIVHQRLAQGQGLHIQDGDLAQPGLQRRAAAQQAGQGQQGVEGLLEGGGDKALEQGVGLQQRAVEVHHQGCGGGAGRLGRFQRLG